MVKSPDQVGDVIRVEEPGTVPIAEARLLPPPILPPPRKRSGWLVVSAAAIGIVAVSLVAFFLLRQGQSAGTKDEAGTAPAPATEGLTITTASGTFSISDVIVGDRYPEGCADSDPSCNRAVPGFQVVVVELAPQGGASTDDISAEGTDSYLVSSDGTRTESFLFGWTTRDDAKVGMVGFTPGDSEEGFTLHWPGNDPVELGN